MTNEAIIEQEKLIKEINILRQENKEMKKDVQLFKCLDTFGESECHCACRCLGNEFCEDADKKINSYRSALEEIREINNKWLKFWMNDSDELLGFEEIQNKINEVLNNSDLIHIKYNKYKSALEEIRSILNKECGIVGNAKAVGIINEVLNDSEG